MDDVLRGELVDILDWAAQDDAVRAVVLTGRGRSFCAGGDIAAFVAANLAGASPMATAVTAVRLGWTALVVPVMFVLSPNLIMQGETGDIIMAFVTAVAGVWVTTCGIQGYFIRPLGLIWRTGFMAAGIMLLTPSEFFSSAIYVEITGIALTVILVGRELLAKRRLSPA